MRRTWHRWLTTLATTGLILASQAFLLAQSQAQEGFQQMSPEDMRMRETLPAAPLVMAAYAIAWIVLVGYVFTLWRRLGRVEQEIADVNRRLPGPTGD